MMHEIKSEDGGKHAHRPEGNAAYFRDICFCFTQLWRWSDADFDKSASIEIPTYNFR